mmetsp:Transcript_100984/g.320546  ORF Transcript_100984/g.320546 Transcript_100984/m.320546 type:complete len:256 (+) Transcript_100984:606-1373(+)
MQPAARTAAGKGGLKHLGPALAEAVAGEVKQRQRVGVRLHGRGQALRALVGDAVGAEVEVRQEVVLHESAADDGGASRPYAVATQVQSPQRAASLQHHRKPFACLLAQAIAAEGQHPQRAGLGHGLGEGFHASISQSTPGQVQSREGFVIWQNLGQLLQLFLAELLVAQVKLHAVVAEVEVRERLLLHHVLRPSNHALVNPAEQIEAGQCSILHPLQHHIDDGGLEVQQQGRHGQQPNLAGCRRGLRPAPASLPA